MKQQKEVTANSSVYYETQSDKVTGFCLLDVFIICNLNTINIAIVISTLYIVLHLEIKICQML